MAVVQKTPVKLVGTPSAFTTSRSSSSGFERKGEGKERSSARGGDDAPPGVAGPRVGGRIHAAGGARLVTTGGGESRNENGRHSAVNSAPQDLEYGLGQSGTIIRTLDSNGKSVLLSAWYGTAVDGPRLCTRRPPANVCTTLAFYTSLDDGESKVQLQWWYDSSGR
jgi:hypothetical protein